MMTDEDSSKSNDFFYEFDQSATTQLPNPLSDKDGPQNREEGDNQSGDPPPKTPARQKTQTPRPKPLKKKEEEEDLQGDSDTEYCTPPPPKKNQPKKKKVVVVSDSPPLPLPLPPPAAPRKKSQPPKKVKKKTEEEEYLDSELRDLPDSTARAVKALARRQIEAERAAYRKSLIDQLRLLT